MLDKQNLESLTKEQLISLILEGQEDNSTEYASEEEIERMKEESLLNEAYMERHGFIDCGYGVGCYGPR